MGICAQTLPNRQKTPPGTPKPRWARSQPSVSGSGLETSRRSASVRTLAKATHWRNRQTRTGRLQSGECPRTGRWRTGAGGSQFGGPRGGRYGIAIRRCSLLADRRSHSTAVTGLRFRRFFRRLSAPNLRLTAAARPRHTAGGTLWIFHIRSLWASNFR